MVRAQAWAPVELVVALHGHPAANLPESAQAALAAADRVLEVPADATLDACLDEAVAAARGEILAKIDDDDLYGPAYLGEAGGGGRGGARRDPGQDRRRRPLRPGLSGGGGGGARGGPRRHSRQDRTLRPPRAERELLLWRPGASHAEQEFVMGGTLVFPRALGVS